MAVRLRFGYLRWVAVMLLLFVASYIASSGPAFYLVGRWPSTRSVYATVYAPLSARVDPKSRLVRLYRQYIFWWYNLGWEHSGRPERMEAAGRKG